MTAPWLKSANLDETIAWYDRTAEAYVADTLARNPVGLRADFIARLPAGGRVLDAGSGSGRDTLAFMNAGFDVDAFDASAALARASSAFTGRTTRIERFETFEGPAARYDGIWAFASLLHVREVDLPDALDRLGRTLKLGGWLFANFKLGSGERLDRFGRRYTDLDVEKASELFKPGMIWDEVSVTSEVAQAAFGESTGWLNLWARRQGQARSG